MDSIKENMRLQNIDLLKGILIILVIIGHVLHGSLENNFGRYIIYSFHMPIFIGISGYLFNYSNLNKISKIDLLSKYRVRLIVPWGVAILIYLIILNILHIINTTTIKQFLYSFVFPYYHLWFIPGFLSWIFITWILKKANFTNKSILIISIIISLLFYILKINHPIYDQIPIINKLMILLLQTFRPYFYVFFVLGIYLKNSHDLSVLNNYNYLIILCLLGVVIVFFFPNKILSTAFFYLFNMLLIRFLISKAKFDLFPHLKITEWIGINSLGIYLYHVIPIMFIRLLFDKTNLYIYYGISLIAIILFIFFFFRVSKIKPINKYLFGL